MDETDFWARVRSHGECWEWKGAVDTRGYGHLRWNGKIVRSHRLAYELSYGPIPKVSGHHGVVVMHKCDNRLCCRPLHLKLGSQGDNIADMKTKGRRKNIGVGSDNGRAVLTVEQVRAIRVDQRSIATIARDYPISRAAVQRIKAGKAWASVV